ncbi:hypothetical protein BJ912DRAFT_373615 [Pholiota molesta]|nr:hypothetical protein BJ912DRAFT_373615 [Pholiota molesta]
MSLLNLPPEIIYDILGEVVASYIDKAITSPPIGGWETMESEGRSEWYTDDDDSSNGDTDLDLDSNDDNGSDDDNSSDQDVDSDGYDSDSESRDSSDEDDSSLSDASADDELSHIVSDVSLSINPTNFRPPENLVQSAMFVEREQVDVETTIVASETNVYLDSVPNDALSLWALEQEQRIDIDDIPAFKLFLWDIIERREKLPTNAIASLLSVCHSVREITLKILSDTLGFDNTAKESTTRGLFFAFFAGITALHIRSHSTSRKQDTQLG